MDKYDRDGDVYSTVHIWILRQEDYEIKASLVTQAYATVSVYNESVLSFFLQQTLLFK